MSKPTYRAIPEAARVAFLSGLLLSVAGCSGEVSRLSQPFFQSDTTGSLVPPEPVYGVGNVASVPATGNSTYRPTQTVQRGSITSAPLAPAPGTSMTSGPISTRSTAPIQQATYQQPTQQVYQPSQPRYVAQQAPVAQPTYQPQPSYAQQRGYGQQELQPRRLPTPPRQIARKKQSDGEGTHRVEYGDTVYSISRRYDVPVSAIIAENDLSAPDNIRVGQRLSIPAGGTIRDNAPVRVAASNHIQTDAAPAPVIRPATQDYRLQRRQVEQAPSSLAPRRVATTAVQGAPAISAPQPPQVAEQRTAMLAPSRPPLTPVNTDPLPDPDSLSGGKFRWPVRGRIIGQFGQRPNGAHNDGINIAVPEGTSIKAAEAGVVAYVGNELKGYGNLVLIRHAEDWVTAYAHSSEVLVRRGDTVQRGQIIAKAGRTGNVDQPQLHFEIRKGSKPQNPLQQLPST